MIHSNLEVTNNVLSAIVPHDKFNKAIEAFTRNFELAEKHGQERGLLIVGPSGSGKTTLAKTMFDMYPPIDETERTCVRVLLISMPQSPTIKDVCKLILSKLGQRFNPRATEYELGVQLQTILKKIGVRMLIIDEAQHLVDGNRINKTHSMVADWIKQLMNDVHISVTLIGIPGVQKLMTASSQLSRRFTKRVTLDGFNVDNKKNKQKLSNIIQKIIERSGYRGVSTYIQMPTSLDMFYYATNGRMSFISELLAEAVRLATKENDVRLTAAHFEQAFEAEIWSDVTAENNPFSGEFAARKLNKIGEPFYEEIV